MNSDPKKSPEMRADQYYETELESARECCAECATKFISAEVRIKHAFGSGYREAMESLESSIKVPMTRIRRLNAVITRFEREFRDDSDFENNEHTNGYFTPRPNQKAIERYEGWKCDLENAHSDLINALKKART
jgi:hypothetical protein